MRNIHGDAKYASDRELRKAGFLSPSGVFLGETDSGEKIRFVKDFHIFTHATTGAGKTTALVLPTLLSYDGGSIVVTDPKGGVLAAQTEARRHELGNRVVFINPWREEVAETLGIDFPDTAFNPLGHLKPDSRSLHDDCKTIAGILCPTPAGDSKPYFTRTARALLAGCMMLLVLEQGQKCTLPALRSMVRDSPDGFKEIASRMLATGAVQLEDYSGQLLGVIDASDQWAGVVGAMHDATEIYSAGDPLGEHLTRDEFDPHDLKREDITVYLIIPPDRADDYQGWLSLLMSVFAQAIGRPGQSRPVLLIMEEFANLGYMSTIAKSMAKFREAGLRCWLIVQDMSQLDRKYTPDGAAELVNLCTVQQYFRVTDNKLADTIEKRVGTVTVDQKSHSTRADKFLDAGSETASQTGVPLLRSQDVLNLPEDRQIILVGGSLRPIYAKLKPYYTDAEMSAQAGDNPYRGASPKFIRNWITPEKITHWVTLFISGYIVLHFLFYSLIMEEVIRLFPVPWGFLAFLSLFTLLTYLFADWLAKQYYALREGNLRVSWWPIIRNGLIAIPAFIYAEDKGLPAFMVAFLFYWLVVKFWRVVWAIFARLGRSPAPAPQMRR